MIFYCFFRICWYFYQQTTVQFIGKTSTKAKKNQTSLGEVSVHQAHCLTKSGKKGFRQSDYLQELGFSFTLQCGKYYLHKLSGISFTDQ